MSKSRIPGLVGAVEHLEGAGAQGAPPTGRSPAPRRGRCSGSRAARATANPSPRRAIEVPASYRPRVRSRLHADPRPSSRRRCPGVHACRRSSRRAAARLQVDAGLHHRGRRHEAARRHPASGAPAGEREDAGDPLDRSVLQPFRADGAARAGRGHPLHADGRGRPVCALLRLHQRREADGEGLHVGAGRPARLRRLVAAASTGPDRASRPTSRPRSSGRPSSRGRPARSACTASPTTA